MVTYEITKWKNNGEIEITYFIHEERYCTHLVERNGDGYKVYVIEKDIQNGEVMYGLNYLGEANSILQVAEHYCDVYPIKRDEITPRLPKN